MSMLGKYFALTRRALGIMLEYRVSMMIWTLSASFPLVMLAVWLTLAQDGPIGGYTAGDFVAYYLLVFYLRQMTSVWVAWEMDYDIRHGDLGIKLLHPLNPFHEYIASNIADKLLRALVFTPIVIFVARIVPGVSYAVSPLNLTLFVAAMILAWLLRYLSQFTIGLFSFWFSQALVLQDIFWMLYLLFGGGVAPLDLLPSWLSTIARFLPFRFMLAFPIEIMQGALSPMEIATGFAAASAWLLLFFLAYRALWQRGIRQFSAFGA